MNKDVNKIAVIGTFDGVHLGHRYLLKVLEEKADKHQLSPMVITFSSHPLETIRPERIPPLLTSLPDKIKLLNELGLGDVEVLNFDTNLRNLSALEFMKLIRDKYGVVELLLGYDTVFGHDRPESVEEYVDLGNAVGLKVSQAQEYILDGVQVCSSRIRKYLTEGNINLANSMLGRPYSITGCVIHGKKLGRKIGFPTANIIPDDSHQLIPHTGVYAVTVTLPEHNSAIGMLNIGYRPTVDNSVKPELSLEVHLFEFDSDIYNQTITLYFIERIRDEKKFANIEELKEQLAVDAKVIRNLQSVKEVPNAQRNRH